ncbi:glycosyltransferase family 39 protein [Cryobacterium roopkundense]|uniref:glycosyltransferase family 39 protein n=1 Tax=Cryobacterium roopkundense TaxID=1001240 RepID=UPI000697FC87|nr:glycosyltransferase family 39 protein [Cryobacterium roopkundense]
MTKASRRFGSQRVADAALLGTIALLVSVAFSWVPSVWFDEAATITSATRSWSDLAHLLESVDLVHGLYYAGMHVWFDIVPYSPFTLRLPSAIFTGLAAGMLTFLTSSITNRRTAVLAGLAFTLLPRVTWSGAEGRSFALGTALAVLMTLVFVAAWRRGRERRRIRTLWWAVYGVLAVLGTGVFLYLALLVVAHGVTAAWTRLAQADSAIEGPGSRTASAGLLGWLGAPSPPP